MSEKILNAILRIFAVVARQDEVTHQEREQINEFLEEHLNEKSIPEFAGRFNHYVEETKHESFEADVANLRQICNDLNNEITRKQKIVIILELIRIVFADAQMTSREEDLLGVAASEFKVDTEDLEAMKRFVSAKEASAFDQPAFLVIDENEHGVYKAGHHIRRTHLNGFIAVLYIESADIYFIRYQGKADVFLNGVPVRRGSIGVFAVGSTLRWDRDEPVFYGDVLNLFKQVKGKSRLSFKASNIGFTFPNGRIGLREVNLNEESGRLVALMGASGAGKSTLLHVLNGSEKPTTGEVIINGINIHTNPERIEGVIGFVPQDDLLIEDLTVYQNLYYAAKLCFNDRNEEEIDHLVLRVLSDLGLEETKDLKVGTPLQKTISGGQRKRLNIGLELLREPAVLFCDEPTSGLSSRDSENIIDLLKELSLKGKLVFAVIHQPSSDIFKKFDRLLILDTGGYQIYYGNPVDAIVHFKRCIDMLNSEQGECHECGNVNPEQIFNIIETKVINEYGHFTNDRKISPERWNEFYKKQASIPPVAPSEDEPHSTLRLPGRLRQAVLFAARDLQAKLHNKQYLYINLLEAPLLAFILAFIVRYYNIDDHSLEGYFFGRNLNIPAYFFMSVIVALFMGLTVSAEEIIRDRKILKREAFLHLSRSSYLLSKLSILFSLSALQTAMFVLVGNYLLEIRGMFPEHWLILFTTSCFANVLGLNISSSFNSAVTIYILIPLLLIPQLVLSGVVVKFDKLNPVIGNTTTVPFVGDLMASRWAFEASMVTQFKDNDYEKMFYPYEKDMATADYKKIYYIPTLETKLQYGLNNYLNPDPDVQNQLTLELRTVRNELTRELAFVGRRDQELLDGLEVGRFDTTVYHRATAFLDALKNFYTLRYNNRDREKEQLITRLTNTPEKEREFQLFRERYHNEAIAEQVKNLMEQHRIVEKDGRLIQKVYPIYKDPDPTHQVDFDAQFYMPAKHFLSRNIDTLFFNTGVIWSMTLVLCITLYFDVLRRIIDGIENISRYGMRKK